MPKLKMCNAPGCGNLIQSGAYCNNHVKSRKDYNKNRPEYSNLYHNARWRKLRIEFLKKNPLCVNCYSSGNIVIAKVVDHIKDHKGDLDLMWDTDNMQALCDSCHNRKTMKSR